MYVLLAQMSEERVTLPTVFHYFTGNKISSLNKQLLLPFPTQQALFGKSKKCYENQEASDSQNVNVSVNIESI